MTEPQSPTVKIGTKLSKGIVTAINSGSVDILGVGSNVNTLSFKQVEKEVESW